MCTCGGPECDGNSLGTAIRGSSTNYESTGPLTLASCVTGDRVHISESHASFSNEQQKILEDGGHGVVNKLLAQECPFCDDWADTICLSMGASTPPVMVAAQDVSVSANLFKRHVAAHQEQLAIFALSRDIEGVETPVGNLIGGVGPVLTTESSPNSESEEPKEGHQQLRTVLPQEIDETESPVRDSINVAEPTSTTKPSPTSGDEVRNEGHQQISAASMTNPALIREETRFSIPVANQKRSRAEAEDDSNTQGKRQSTARTNSPQRRYLWRCVGLYHSSISLFGLTGFAVSMRFFQLMGYHFILSKHDGRERLWRILCLQPCLS